MDMILLDGKKTANDIKEEIAIEVSSLITNGGKKPHLAAILVGTDGASETYVNAKVKACKMVGFDSTLVRFDNTVSELDLFIEIEKINNNPDIDGLLVQLPLPSHIDEMKVTQSINPTKDVDGFHPANIGRMALNLPTYLPATPAGILELLERYNVESSGKHCVVIGRSHIVGSPISILMAINNNPGNCTVTLTHSRTTNLKEITKTADILIVALGKAEFITSDMIKEGVCIIDVGITRVKSDKTKSGWKLLGDVNFEDVKDKCSFITPVPGGVGPMTIAMLLQNTLLSSKKRISLLKH
jgi:methylenetetrahydrofolate dehydrogenase (NADP+)/methenyltetrahydrofolate cyclohydrolase